MRRNLYCVLAALAGLMLGPTVARADITWPSPETVFKIEWTFSPVDVPQLVLPSDNHPSAALTVTSGKDGFYEGYSTIVAANLKTISNGTRSNSSHLVDGGLFYLTATVHDRASGTSQQYTFGVKAGVLKPPAPGQSPYAGAEFGKFFSDLDFSISNTDPVAFHFAESGTTVTLQLDSFVRIDAAGSTGQGAITGTVNFSGPGNIQRVPEPSSLLLGAFGLSLAGGAWWRKRRQTAAL